MRALALPALLLGVVAHAQTAHLIRGLDHYFQPDTLVMVVGDSVRFQTQQMHNMLQVSEADWLLNFAVPNGGFQTVLGQDSTFAIDTAGTYYFVCEPHGFMGMKGVLLVAPNPSTAVHAPQAGPVGAYPVPADDVVNVPVVRAPAVVRLRGVDGRILLDALQQHIGPACLRTGHLPAGNHLVEVEDAHGIRRARIAVVH